MTSAIRALRGSPRIASALTCLLFQQALPAAPPGALAVAGPLLQRRGPAGLPAGGHSTRSAPRLRGPTLGMVSDAAAGRIRPILGLPGSATLGEPLDFVPPVSRALISQEQDYALVEAGIERRVLLVHLFETADAVSELPGVPAAPDLIALSPAGTAAAFFHGAHGVIRIVAGLPSQPSVAAELEATYFAGQGLSALAVSDDGRGILAAALGEGGESVFFVSGTGVRFLASLGKTAGLAFASSGEYAVLADGATSRVYAVHDVAGAAGIVVLGEERQGISRPVGVAVSRDGRRVFVANSHPGGVVVLDREKQEAELVPCPCTPTGLARLRGDAVFLLAGPPASPIWVLDGDATRQRVVFVPSGGTSLPQAGVGEIRIPAPGRGRLR